MARLNQNRRRRKTRVMKRHPVLTRRQYEALGQESRLQMIRALVPLGLMAVEEELTREVDAIAGGRYSHEKEDGQGYRHGSNPGSVRLAGQRVPIRVPRVRTTEGEVPLRTYETLQGRGEIDEQMFRRVLHGISCRNYEAAAEGIPGAIGLGKSTISRRFIEASKETLRAFQERDLSKLDIVAIFVDGKSFAEDQMVIAMGVTMQGNKLFLGFIQTDTENKTVLTTFFKSLILRGLNVSKGLLAILDGAKGLHSAAKKAFRKRVLIQRCQWHKRENVVSYLSKDDQPLMRKRLTKAFERPTEQEAEKAIAAIRGELEETNLSAAESLKEGLNEILTLHRLGVFPLFGRSFKTTNCLESVNAQAEERCARIDYWKNSEQKHRWLAAALMDIEPRLNRVMGNLHLPKLRAAIMHELKITQPKKAFLSAA